MPFFAYKGRNARGEMMQGVLEGVDAGACADQLVGTGVTPLEITPTTRKATTSGGAAAPVSWSWLPEHGRWLRHQRGSVHVDGSGYTIGPRNVVVMFTDYVASPADPRSPGRRCSEDMEALTNPTAYLNTWCDVGDESYWVSFKEPWSEELDSAKVKGYNDLLAHARVWGKVAGAMHRLGTDPALIEARLAEPRLFNQLFSRATQYMEVLYQQHQAFAGDPRTTELAGRAQARIDEAFAKARAMRD